jgi:predicted small lipoprotein YifL
MTPRARAAFFAVLVAAGASGCGQQGPLSLPADARPIERVEPQPPSEPDTTDDERERER